MYLDKVFIKHPNIFIVPNKRTSLCFPIYRQKVNRNKKNDCKIPLKESKIVNHFHLKMCFLKNSALASVIILSVIAATSFITAKQNAIFTPYGNFAFDKQAS